MQHLKGLIHVGDTSWLKVCFSRIKLIPSESQKNDNNETRTLSRCMCVCVCLRFVFIRWTKQKAPGTVAWQQIQARGSLPACRPAEITQVSLSRLFSAFMTAKWREEERKKQPDNKTTSQLPSKKADASKQAPLSPIKLWHSTMMKSC